MYNDEDCNNMITQCSEKGTSPFCPDFVVTGTLFGTYGYNIVGDLAKSRYVLAFYVQCVARISSPFPVNIGVLVYCVLPN